MRIEGSRHQGIKASSERRSAARFRGRGFSLVEVLIAVMILALGIISIAALFPAGIAQQRLSNDDIMGPAVAAHAMSVIRSKVSDEDFGMFEQFAGGILQAFGTTGPYAYYSRTIPGDWNWMRPGFILPEPGMASDWQHLAGAIDIFGHMHMGFHEVGPPDYPNLAYASEFGDVGWPTIDFPAVDPALYGIPHNFHKHGNVPPRITISQRERYYPMPPKPADPDAARTQRPQYVWDCMFRRYQGKVYVAVFVYRASAPAAGSRLYTVQPNSNFLWSDDVNPTNIGYLDDRSPLPFRVDLTDDSAHSDWYEHDVSVPGLAGSWNLRGAWDVGYQSGPVERPVPFVPGTMAGESYDENDPRQSWQQSRQWLLDQNNNIHRVLARTRQNEALPFEIELTEPLSPVRAHLFEGGANTVDPAGFDNPFHQIPFHTHVPDYYYAAPASDPTNVPLPRVDKGVVSEIWYIPRFVIDADGTEWTLTPVYVGVKEL